MLPMVVGHRGTPREHPENTLASLLAAVALDADGVETDIRLSRDGVAVLFHDPTLERLAGRPEAVSELTARELREIVLREPCGASAHPLEGVMPAVMPGEPSRIALLSEALAAMKGWAGHRFLELKPPASAGRAPERESGNRRELVASVARELDGEPAELVTILSFDREILREAGRRLPGLRRGLILSGDQTEQDWRRATALGTDLLVLRDRLACRERLDRLAEAGRSVFVYPVNDVADARRLSRSPVEGFISDEPRRLLDARG